jgi:hypothetical protein
MIMRGKSKRRGEDSSGPEPPTSVTLPERAYRGSSPERGPDEKFLEPANQQGISHPTTRRFSPATGPTMVTIPDAATEAKVTVPILAFGARRANPQLVR